MVTLVLAVSPHMTKLTSTVSVQTKEPVIVPPGCANVSQVTKAKVARDPPAPKAAVATAVAAQSTTTSQPTPPGIFTTPSPANATLVTVVPLALCATALVVPIPFCTHLR